MRGAEKRDHRSHEPRGHRIRLFLRPRRGLQSRPMGSGQRDQRGQDQRRGRQNHRAPERRQPHPPMPHAKHPRESLAPMPSRDMRQLMRK